MTEPTPSQANPSAATIDHLKTLIAFDSVSRNSNLDLIDWARGVLETAGARTRLSLNRERTKANLFATFGEGPQGDRVGGLVLSGHTDVVPVDGQIWQSDPFQADIRDGLLYGRGACDMKGFCAVVLARAPQLAARGLRAPLHVAFSCDEEIGCVGVPDLLDDLREAGIRPAGCVVGEPTSMRLIGAHKGGDVYRCRVCGSAAHSSLAPRAVNAVEYAGRMLTLIQQIADDFAEHGPFDPAFDVPHPTISANRVDGGTATNIVAALCEFVFEYRVLPGLDAAPIMARIRGFADTVLLPRMRAVSPQADIVFERLAHIPGLRQDSDSAVFTAACAQLASNGADKVAFGTEAGYFQEYGIPAIVCGPGSIEQAHKADEFVPLAELAECERFIDGMVERLLT
jgi:acetylornithine deacetylase